MHKLTKAKAKQLKHLSSQLPTIPMDINYHRSIRGEELIASGVSTIANEQVKPKAMYHGETKSKVLVNHFRRLKSAYESDGEKGVEAYITATLKTALKLGIIKQKTPQVENGDGK